MFGVLTAFVMMMMMMMIRLGSYRVHVYASCIVIIIFTHKNCVFGRPGLGGFKGRGERGTWQMAVCTVYSIQD